MQFFRTGSTLKEDNMKIAKDSVGFEQVQQLIASCPCDPLRSAIGHALTAVTI